MQPYKYYFNKYTMIKLTYRTNLLAMLLVVIAAFMTSCKKETEEDLGIVQLESFGPTGAKHGDTVKFIGTNLNKVTAIHFTGTNAVVNQADFKKQTSETKYTGVCISVLNLFFS